MLWLIIGIVLGLGAMYLVIASRSGRPRVRWYQWLLGVVAMSFLLLALQNYLALQNELEPKLANFVAVAFGLSGVISAALIWLIPSAARLAKRKAATARVEKA